MPISTDTRIAIYNILRTHLAQCVPPMVVKEDAESMSYELIGNQPVPYGYDKKIISGMYFASIAQRKDSVAFYFFPAYMHPQLQQTAPTLYKRLKGKSCFHFKKEEQVHQAELEALLKAGVQVWKKAGYIRSS